MKHYIRILSLLLIFLSLTTARSSALAETANLQEQRALDFVEAFNSGFSPTYESYMQANRATSVLESATALQRAESFTELLKMFGTFKVLGAMQPSDTETRLLVEAEAAGEQFEIVFSHEPKEEFKVLGIGFEPVSLPVEVDPDWQDLGALLKDYVAQSGVPAWAAAVVKDGKVIAQAAEGTLVIGGDERVDVDQSQFHWGSVTKSMTGSMIGALIESGKLNWDTTIGDVFKEKGIVPAYKSVTISQLMSHRAGVPPYENFTAEDMVVIQARAPDSIQDQRRLWALHILRNDQPIFVPGEGKRYSNAGITIAGVMAELVSDMSWEQLVKETLLNPAEMGNSGFGWPASTESPLQPHGHFGSGPNDQQVAPVDAMQDLLEAIAPAGNLRSTIGDMARYAALHLNGMDGHDDVLTAATVKRLHTALPKEQSAAEPYSFGWGQRTLADGRVIHWHNGGAGTFYAEIRLIPELKLGIVLAANAGFAERAIDPLWQAIYERYADL